VRYDRRVGEGSAIRFLTDGVLLRQLQSDFLLSRYSVLLIDEAHERSLNTDLLLGGRRGAGPGAPGGGVGPPAPEGGGEGRRGSRRRAWKASSSCCAAAVQATGVPSQLPRASLCRALPLTARCPAARFLLRQACSRASYRCGGACTRSGSRLGAAGPRSTPSDSSS
jgi:hypothetical protein